MMRQQRRAARARPAGPSPAPTPLSRPPTPTMISRSSALGDADVGVQAEALGAGLDVGDDLAGGQADQRRRPAAVRVVLRRPGSRRPRRRRRRRRSGPWSSRAARRTCRSRRASGPSCRRARRSARRRVTITCAGDQVAAGAEAERADEHADGAGDGDRVRGDARRAAGPGRSGRRRTATTAARADAEDLRHGGPTITARAPDRHGRVTLGRSSRRRSRLPGVAAGAPRWVWDRCNEQRRNTSGEHG